MDWVGKERIGLLGKRVGGTEKDREGGYMSVELQRLHCNTLGGNLSLSLYL